MPNTPRATDGEAPKKRARKTAATPGDSTKVAPPVKVTAKTAKPQAVAEVAPAITSQIKVSHPPIEERIRARAYELYLRRGGIGGSPEQDWFQAASEIRGESVV